MRLCLFDDGVERCRVADGQFAEHFAVQLDAGGDQGGDEAVIAQAALAQGGAEAGDPQGAEVPLLLLAVLVGVDVGLAGEFECGPIIVAAHPAHARGTAKDALALAGVRRPTFNAWHGSILSGYTCEPEARGLAVPATRRHLVRIDG